MERWYPTCVTTPVPGNLWFKSSQLLRWRMRGLLKALPARAVFRTAGDRSLSVPAAGRFRIAYLFAGTYGDFVQALRPLNRLAAAYPDAEIHLLGADRYAHEFGSELPDRLRIANPMDPMQWMTDPVDLLFTNCVGVYRVRFDFVARFCAVRAFGFRHAHESHRGGYAATIPLLPQVRNFAEENLKILDLAGVPHEEPKPVDADLPAWGKGKILFHIGSAGLKREFGLKAYTRLVLGVLNRLDGRPVEVVMGPGDEDIALEVRTGTGFVPQMYPLSRLFRILRSFEGTVLCFNSFPAHICQYLGRSAIVMHREAVPYGYDCAPLHNQVVLKSQADWDLGAVWHAIQAETPV
jgi:ADP-heptose:LPS heptosyltransferase